MLFALSHTWHSKWELRNATVCQYVLITKHGRWDQCFNSFFTLSNMQNKNKIISCAKPVIYLRPLPAVIWVMEGEPARCLHRGLVEDSRWPCLGAFPAYTSTFTGKLIGKWNIRRLQKRGRDRGGQTGQRGYGLGHRADEAFLRKWIFLVKYTWWHLGLRTKAKKSHSSLLSCTQEQRREFLFLFIV